MYRQDHQASDYTDETIRSGRPKAIGQGGVCVYIHEGLTAECRDVWKKSIANIDILIVHLTDISIAIVIIYRPPESTPEAFRQAIEHIDTVLDDINAAKNIFLGDFNLETVYNPTPEKKTPQVIPEVPYTIIKPKKEIYSHPTSNRINT